MSTPNKETHPAPVERPLGYSLKDALAKLKGIAGRSKVYQDMRSGRLPAKKNGNRTIILPNDLEAYVANLPDYAPKKQNAEI